MRVAERRRLEVVVAAVEIHAGPRHNRRAAVEGNRRRVAAAVRERRAAGA